MSSAPAAWEDRTARLDGGKGLQDVIYRVAPADGVAKITINRPRVRNAFRPITVRELRVAVAAAQDDTDVVRT